MAMIKLDPDLTTSLRVYFVYFPKSKIKNVRQHRDNPNTPSLYVGLYKFTVLETHRPKPTIR